MKSKKRQSSTAKCASSQKRTRETLESIKDQHRRNFLKMAGNYELLKILVARRSSENKLVRGLLQSLHLFKSQKSIARDHRRDTLSSLPEDTSEIEREIGEGKRKLWVVKNTIISLKEETVFANMRRVELIEEIKGVKHQHAEHMAGLIEELGAQREKCKRDEEAVSQSCTDYKRNASSQASRMESQQGANLNTLSRLKHEIEVSQGLLKEQSKSFTVYGTLKEFVAASLGSRSNSRSSSVRTRNTGDSIKKPQAIPSIKLNSSFSIRKQLQDRA